MIDEIVGSESFRRAGHTREQLMGSPSLKQAWDDKLGKMIGDLPIVGHNVADFDVPLIEQSTGKSMRNPIYDTLKMAREFGSDPTSRMRPQAGADRPNALENIMRRFVDPNYVQEHTALADVRDNERVLHLLENVAGEEGRYIQPVTTRGTSRTGASFAPGEGQPDPSFFAGAPRGRRGPDFPAPSVVEAGVIHGAGGPFVSPPDAEVRGLRSAEVDDLIGDAAIRETRAPRDTPRARTAGEQSYQRMAGLIKSYIEASEEYTRLDRDVKERDASSRRIFSEQFEPGMEMLGRQADAADIGGQQEDIRKRALLSARTMASYTASHPFEISNIEGLLREPHAAEALMGGPGLGAAGRSARSQMDFDDFLSSLLTTGPSGEIMNVGDFEERLQSLQDLMLRGEPDQLLQGEQRRREPGRERYREHLSSALGQRLGGTSGDDILSELEAKALDPDAADQQKELARTMRMPQSIEESDLIDYVRARAEFLEAAREWTIGESTVMSKANDAVRDSERQFAGMTEEAERNKNVNRVQRRNLEKARTTMTTAGAELESLFLGPDRKRMFNELLPSMVAPVAAVTDIEKSIGRERQALLDSSDKLAAAEEKVRLVERTMDENPQVQGLRRQYDWLNEQSPGALLGPQRAVDLYDESGQEGRLSQAAYAAYAQNIQARQTRAGARQQHAEAETRARRVLPDLAQQLAEKQAEFYPPELHNQLADISKTMKSRQARSVSRIASDEDLAKGLSWRRENPPQPLG